MKRVIVIGSGGAGKSTFARRLGEITGLPVIHLDVLYWKPGWVPTAADEWADIVRRETEKPEWIMDGNFGGTREMRMNAADTIVMLDLPRWICMLRIIKRWFIYRNKTRPDMTSGCNAKFDWDFLLWVWNYKNRSRVRALEELRSQTEKKIIILNKRRDVAECLDRLRLEYQ